MAATSGEQSLEVSVFTAYLEPLLKKHNNNELITYEDLSQSWSSANRTLGKQSSDQPADQVESTRGKIKLLHKSQLDAYHATARTSLVQWAKTEWELPAPTGGTIDSYKKQCTEAAKAAGVRPQWNTPKTVLAEIASAVEERAVAQWEKSNVVPKGESPRIVKTTEVEIGEVKEDEAISGDDGEVKEEPKEAGETTAKATSTKQPPSKKTVPAKTALKKGGINAKRKAQTESTKQTVTAPPAKKATTVAIRGAAGKRGGRQRGVVRGNNTNNKK